MTYKLIQEIQLRLKAPIIALERIARGQYLPKVFAGAALDEIKKMQKLVEKLEKQKRG